MKTYQRAKAVVVSIPNEGVEQLFGSQKEAAEFLGVTPNVVWKHMTLTKGAKALRLRGVVITEHEPTPVREHLVDDFPVQVGKGGRPIRQLDRYTHEILATFKNMSEAVNVLGLKKTAITGISKCCRGEVQHSQGFKWEFADID